MRLLFISDRFALKVVNHVELCFALKNVCVEAVFRPLTGGSIINKLDTGLRGTLLCAESCKLIWNASYRFQPSTRSKVPRKSMCLVF